MKSNKWIFGLMTIVLLLALAPSGFAQTVPAVQLSLLNSASNSEVKGNHQAQTSSPASFNQGIIVSASVFQASVGLTTANLVLTFPVNITSGITFPSAAEGIRITGATGIFQNVSGGTVTVVSIAISTSASTITLTLPAYGTVNPGDAGFFYLAGVRVSTSTLALLSPVAISTNSLSSNTGYVAPASNPTLISTVQAGLSSTSGASGTATGTTTPAASNGVATVFISGTSTTIADANASVVFTEPFASAWRTATQASTSGIAATNGTNIKISIANLPAGMTATFTQQVGGTSEVGASSSPFPLTSTTTSQVVTLSSTNLGAIDQLGYEIVLSGTPTTTPSATSLIVTASFDPAVGIGGVIGDYATSGNGFSTATGYPRYDVVTTGTTLNTTSVTIGSIIPLQTTMLMPYALNAGGYHSSIAIANTSLDPFATGSAVATDGTIQFWLFPNSTFPLGNCNTIVNGSCTVTTSGSNAAAIGLGLNATTGKLPAGGEYAADITQILTAAGMTTSGSPSSFVGYIFIQANFPNGHGVGYIFNPSGVLTSATNIGVVIGPSIVGRSGTSTNNYTESLGF